MLIFLNGRNYKEAVALHKNHVSEEAIRQAFAEYRKRGITFVRDGGDAPACVRICVKDRTTVWDRLPQPDVCHSSQRALRQDRRMCPKIWKNTEIW